MPTSGDSSTTRPELTPERSEKRAAGLPGPRQRNDEPMGMIVAGREVDSPVEVLLAYAQRLGKTVRRYDAPGPGLPDVLTGEEVTRTRVIASRISNAERAWFLNRARTAPWVDVDPQLRLADLDPEDDSQQYEAAVRLYDHFREPRRAGVAVAKLSKVLHLKRPHLVPILDSQLVVRYRSAARRLARAYPQVQPPASALFWLAVREDLVRPGVADVLQAVRAQLREHHLDEARLLADVSDVRLLDILVWARSLSHDIPCITSDSVHYPISS